jgi:phosphoribosyl-dephospho-CoA transferase
MRKPIMGPERKMKRHDLVEITDEGRRWASEHLAQLIPCNADNGHAIKLIVEKHDGVNIPGIVRREENRPIEGAVPVGFSSPEAHGDKRFRVGAFVPSGEIVAIRSPYQVLEGRFSTRTPCLRVLPEIRRVAEDMAIRLGAWGSAGLEIETGLPYTHDGSDLDLLVEPTELGCLDAFGRQAFSTGRRYGCRVDIEIDLPSGYGINLLEWLSGSNLLLGKALHGVDLIPRSSILNLYQDKS